MASRLADVGLGGADRKITFSNAAECRLQVMQLMADGHGHHFAVVGEGRTLILSPMAVRCLLGCTWIEDESEEDRRS